MAKSSFMKEYEFDNRVKQFELINKRFNDKLPVIIDFSTEIQINNCYNQLYRKFLVPKDINLGEFMYSIRKTMKLQPEYGIFLFINNKLLNNISLLSEIYKEHKNEDGFLYVDLKSESTMGNDK